MSSFNTCEHDLVQRYGEGAIDEFIGALASAAVSVEEERIIYDLGACLIADVSLEEVA